LILAHRQGSEVQKMKGQGFSPQIKATKKLIKHAQDQGKDPIQKNAGGPLYPRGDLSQDPRQVPRIGTA
jgi:hypothetical protein